MALNKCIRLCMETCPLEIMRLQIEDNVNVKAAEITEYIDRFSFWVDTRGKSDEKPIKGAYLTVVGKEEFALLRTLAYLQTLRDASIAESQETFLRHARFAHFEVVYRWEV